MKLKWLVALLILLGMKTLGQEFAVNITPKSVKILPGAPASLLVAVTNQSQKDLWIVGKCLKDGIILKDSLLLDAQGKKLECSSNNVAGSSTGSFPNAPIKDKVLFKSGETFEMCSGIYTEKGCPLSQDISGKWTLRKVVEIMIAEGPLVKDIRYAEAVGEMEVEFQKAEGEDLAYIEAVKEWLNNADPKELKGYTAEVKPLTWGELLTSRRIPVTQILLQKYPTSTYAGYVLVKYGPSGSLKDASKITPEKFDERFYVVGSDEEKEKKRKEAKQKYEDFILQARKYLALHPEFPMASLLKKEIVNALFYTDRKDEAWIEMEALSKMEGEWAEEAKAVLAKKNEKSNKPEEKGGQSEKRE